MLRLTQSRIVLLGLSLIFVLSAHAASRRQAVDRVAIYYWPFTQKSSQESLLVPEKNHIENLVLHWEKLNGRRSGPEEGRTCLFRRNKAAKIYAEILPILNRAREGIFLQYHIRMKIINRTTGADTYIDVGGGVYTEGEYIARQIHPLDFDRLLQVMNEAYDRHCQS